MVFFFIKEQAAILEEFEMTKQKRSKKEEEKSVEEKTTLHGNEKCTRQIETQTLVLFYSYPNYNSVC